MKAQHIDIGLDVLCRLAKENQTLTLMDIAEVCDCSKSEIARIEKKALKKLRHRMAKGDWLDG